MQIFRPTYGYLRVLALCVIIVLIFVAVKRQAEASIVAVAGVAYLLPSFIINPKLLLSDDNTLTYKMTWAKESVDLSKISNCTYHLQIGRRAMPMMVFHLYDSDGGHTTFPANVWLSRKGLYQKINQAVTYNHVKVDEKTAKKLGLSLDIQQATSS